MAEQTSLLEEPQAGAIRTPPPVSSAGPPSPTRSIWKRFLNRSANGHSEVPFKGSPVKRNVSPPPVSPVSSLALEAVTALEASAPLVSASGDLNIGGGIRPHKGASVDGSTPDYDDGAASRPAGVNRRAHREVVPGLPRTQTLARQQSELRENLLPVKPSPAERRAASVDRRLTRSVSSPTTSQVLSNPRTSAPNISHRPQMGDSALAITGLDTTSNCIPPVPSVPSFRATASSDQPLRNEAEADHTTVTTRGHQKHDGAGSPPAPVASDGDHHHSLFDKHSFASEMSRSAEEAYHVETASMNSSQYEQRIRYELEHVWILNLSMHFRDKSRREKFFVTYRQRPELSRRVTISLDYRNAPENSLEMDLLDTKLQRDKNEMIYEAIRESLVDIQFYDTVTNLKLQTTNGRLHVHVVEDVTEIIDYPSGQYVQHLGCRKIGERDVEFDSHMSGFVYKVRVNGRMLIKKEIPGPDSVDEFLYEVNALNFLRDSRNVIELYGVIIGDDDRVKGLLISYAEQGALIDIIYENNHGIPWLTRMKWARQIVLGLSEIHEAGFVQGDFTLSNIVIDDDGNAKIIDINRRGCPVGWEPPEATPLIQSDQRISMYIGVKSDLYQLGMVLWALATQDDDPEAHGRPLRLDGDVSVPQWYRTIVETCLAEDPRVRAQARQLLSYFPSVNELGQLHDSDYDDDWIEGPRNAAFYAHSAPSGSVDDGDNSFRHMAGIESAAASDKNVDGVENCTEDGNRLSIEEYNSLGPRIKTVTPNNDWSYVDFGHTYVDAPHGVSNEPYYYPTRGRSPPSPIGGGNSYDFLPRAASWTRTTRTSEDRSPNRSQEGQGRSPSPNLHTGDIITRSEEASVGFQPTTKSGTATEATQISSHFSMGEVCALPCKGDSKLDGTKAVEADTRGESTSSRKISAINEAVLFPTNIEMAAQACPAAIKTYTHETDTGITKSKHIVDRSLDESAEESCYEIRTDPLVRKTASTATTNLPQTGDSNSDVWDQTKDVGAIYEDRHRSCLDLCDDKKGIPDGNRRPGANGELNAIVTI